MRKSPLFTPMKTSLKFQKVTPALEYARTQFCANKRREDRRRWSVTAVAAYSDEPVQKMLGGLGDF